MQDTRLLLFHSTQMCCFAFKHMRKPGGAADIISLPGTKYIQLLHSALCRIRPCMILSSSQNSRSGFHSFFKWFSVCCFVFFFNLLKCSGCKRSVSTLIWSSWIRLWLFILPKLLIFHILLVYGFL